MGSAIPGKVSSRTSFLCCGWFNLSEEFFKSIRWKLGRGDKIHFWRDIWCGNSPSVEKYSQIFAIAENTEVAVKQIWVDCVSGGDWLLNLRRISCDVQVQEVAELPLCLDQKAWTLAVMIPWCGGRIRWKIIKSNRAMNGKFLLK
ncbi:hypothetical protein QJS10_CPB17g00303 [Acorus calamus]|uniref:Uncharacterized protein n=1 Tax=Acorus calamus TaxID=4465 RepID=A0AAV9CVF6_ACOCL|nr:hypothetical protein QJS10_CPB17g00303 [Acorus calamus]